MPGSRDASPDRTGPVSAGVPLPDAGASGAPSPSGHPSDPPVAAADADGLAEDATDDVIVEAELADLLPEDDSVDAEEEQDYLADLLRVQADFENYKKRMIKQQTEHLERAAEGLVTKLLPVLDAGDLALSHGAEEVGAVVGMLREVLGKDGLEVVAPEAGEGFDPTLHDAVAHEDGDGDGEPAVVETMRAGYRWKGRLIRPAMVRVKG